MDFNEWYIKTMKGEIKDRWPAAHWGDKTNNYMSDYMGIESLDKIIEWNFKIKTTNPYNVCLEQIKDYLK